MQTERAGMLRRIAATFVAIATLAFAATATRAAAFEPRPFAQLKAQVRALASRLPAQSALEIFDLSTGYRAGFNAGNSMPAASTIKVPVMVEVFRQLEAGRFDLDHRVTLLNSDKDWGSGELCDAPAGSTYPVSELLSKMIDISDNTATNMLIRLVGRHSINDSMIELGLERTHLADDVRTEGWAIRRELRTSPADLVRLLAMMARRELVDEWSSNEMITILSQDQFNSMLPEPLPDDVMVAHKTGSLNDTMNDAGIVYASDAPYVIAVMTTDLPSQDMGREFVRNISRLAFNGETRFARWREENGFAPAPFSFGAAGSAAGAQPDVRYWSSGVLPGDGLGGGGGR